MERSRFLLGYDRIDQTGEGEMNSVLLHVGFTMDQDEVNVPKLPYDWVESATNTAKGCPTFDKVGSPG